MPRNEADTPTYTNGGWTEAEDDSDAILDRMDNTTYADSSNTEDLWDTMTQNPAKNPRPRRSSAGQRRKKLRKLFGPDAV